MTVEHVEPFDPDRGGPGYLFKSMADHIAARIRCGELSPDARLAGERALAEEYGVSLGTARRAVAELGERGLVVVLPAKGTYVAPAAGARADCAHSEPFPA
ncbi:winged helix-turn-helix domain-containing protein [Phytoactinopolyspora mesophila]|uniref:GntR family transcriptional regulator n=1 Tax=Phytoactinopolyspora mesophila TaxID=2650750 RepID=A0A7K3MCF1_9ACTN|nr:winged helix-turn-helix domain-containing protein [Phytoactinopolyspora mesophila]NDL61001.1 GntR family transcriptional regulator [Phytoactinopolyspora mesophila]